MAGWPKPPSTGMPGKCGLPASSVTLFRRRLLSPDRGLAQVRWHLPETPFCCGLGSAFVLAVKQLPLGHGSVAGGGSAGCTPGAGSSCQASLPTPRGSVSPDETLPGCEYRQMK